MHGAIKWRVIKAIQTTWKTFPHFIQWEWSNAGVRLMSSRTLFVNLASDNTAALLSDWQYYPKLPCPTISYLKFYRHWKFHSDLVELHNCNSFVSTNMKLDERFTEKTTSGDNWFAAIIGRLPVSAENSVLNLKQVQIWGKLNIAGNNLAN